MEGLSTTELIQIIMSNQVVLMTALLNAGAFQSEDKDYIRTMLRHNAELLTPETMKLMQIPESA